MSTREAKPRTPKRLKQITPPVTAADIAAAESFSGAPKYQTHDAPEIARLVGPALQEAIADVNKAIMNMLVVAARLGPAEPLASDLLGVDREVLEQLAVTGRAEMLLAQAHGLPLAALRISDPTTLRRVIGSGLGSPEAMSAITKSMPLELVQRATRKSGGRRS